QPARRRAQQLHVFRGQPGLLVELAVHRLDRGFIAAHPALRELPAITAHPARPEHVSVLAHQHDADVGPVSVRIDHDADSNKFDCTQSATAPAGRQAAIDTAAGNVKNSRFAGTAAPSGASSTAAATWLCSSDG